MDTAALVPMKFGGGLPETPCGAGSTLQATEPIREWLPVLFRKLDVQIILDAPCGDFNWMAHTDLSGIDYIGADNDMQHVMSAKLRESVAAFKPKSKRILHFDLTRWSPPYADLILCRDCLQHLPNERVDRVLKRFRKSRAPWLLVTSHRNAGNRDIRKDGDYRPLNLLLPPFNFPRPLEHIDDCGRMLGLWSLRNGQ